MKLFFATVIVYAVRTIWVVAALAFVLAVFISAGVELRVALYGMSAGLGLVLGLVLLVLVYGWACDVRSEARR